MRVTDFAPRSATPHLPGRLLRRVGPAFLDSEAEDELVVIPTSGPQVEVPLLTDGRLGILEELIHDEHALQREWTRRVVTRVEDTLVAPGCPFRADQRLAAHGDRSYSLDVRRDEAIAVLRGYLPELRREFGVRRIALFGSTARDEARADSDLDILVEFDTGPTFDSYFGVKFFLEDHLARKVDLVTPDALKPRMRPIVQREAVDVA